MQLLDSSVIIAVLNTEDSLHEKAKALYLHETAFNELVLAEVSNFLQKKMKEKEKVASILHNLVETTPLVLATARDLHDALKVFFVRYPRLSFTDAVLVAQAKNLNAGIITFDENLKQTA